MVHSGYYIYYNFILDVTQPEPSTALLLKLIISTYYLKTMKLLEYLQKNCTENLFFINARQLFQTFDRQCIIERMHNLCLEGVF